MAAAVVNLVKFSKICCEPFGLGLVVWAGLDSAIGSRRNLRFARERR
ncbi:MAG: hypothetical protein M2R45_02462 [Verrucomicrobia subdivision 3 bacterium]|nr:hypothetical protein [Limisphaerales bacterium]